jgi:hypothetical protein
MRLRIFFVLVLVFVLPLLAVSARADILGAADTYAVLATTAVTDAQTGVATVINGFSATSPTMGAVSCTGFVLGNGCTSPGSGVVNGVTNLSNASYTAALADSNIAYTALSNTTDTGTFTCLGAGSCLNNVAPGVYRSTLTSTLWSGALTLAGDGNPNDIWIFQFAAGLTTATGSSLLLSGTGTGAGVYFQVGSQATLGQDSVLQGNFLAGTSVVFAPGAQITCGRAFTDTAAGTAVTFAGGSPTPQNNLVSVGPCANGSTSGLNGGVLVPGGPGGVDTVGPGTGGATVPEPGTLALLSSGLLAMVLLAFRKSRVSSLSLSC